MRRLSPILVYVTVDRRSAAEKLARLVLERHRAAAAHITGPFLSQFWWKGKLRRKKEWGCSFRTVVGAYPQVEKLIRAAHPYEVPEIFASPIAIASPPYLKWLRENSIAKREVRRARKK